MNQLKNENNPFAAKKDNSHVNHIKGIILLLLIGFAVLLVTVDLSDYPLVGEAGEQQIALQGSMPFVADEQLLGHGQKISLTADNTSDTTDKVKFISSGTSNKYEQVIEPGVYTIEYVSGDDLVFACRSGASATGYLFGPERDGEIVNKFVNLTITGDEQIFIEAAGGYELKLIPQAEYIAFDQDDIQPGVYTAGQAIDPGTYNFSSKGRGRLNITMYSDDQELVINTDDQPEVKLKKGDTVFFDNQDTIFQQK